LFGDATTDTLQRKMSGQPRHASYSRRPNNQPDSAVRAGRTISSPQLWLTDEPDDALNAPHGRPDALSASRSFTILQPSPGDDVFGTLGSHPAMTGTYSLPRRKGISRAVYMASTVQPRQAYFGPLSCVKTRSLSAFVLLRRRRLSSMLSTRFRVWLQKLVSRKLAMLL
jgi:hypothetical protein